MYHNALEYHDNVIFVRHQEFYLKLHSYQEESCKFLDQIGQLILDAQSSNLVDNDVFVPYFKGLQFSDVPLDHIPPLYGKSQISWVKNEHNLGLFVFYNAWKKAEEYSPNGSDNLDEATIDGTPSWWTLNFSYSVNISTNLVAQLNVENILDAHYKTFSSGISAPGRNIILSLKTEF